MEYVLLLQVYVILVMLKEEGREQNFTKMLKICTVGV